MPWEKRPTKILIRERELAEIENQLEPIAPAIRPEAYFRNIPRESNLFEASLGQRIKFWSRKFDLLRKTLPIQIFSLDTGRLFSRDIGSAFFKGPKPNTKTRIKVLTIRKPTLLKNSGFWKRKFQWVLCNLLKTENPVATWRKVEPLKRGLGRNMKYG